MVGVHELPQAILFGMEQDRRLPTAGLPRISAPQTNSRPGVQLGASSAWVPGIEGVNLKQNVRK